MIKMNALLLRNDGFAKTVQAIGNRLEAPQEHLRYGTVPRPTPGKGQILIRLPARPMWPLCRDFTASRGAKARPLALKALARLSVPVRG